MTVTHEAATRVFTDPTGSWSTPADILASAASARAERNRADLVVLHACVAWAITHPVGPDDDWSHDPCLGGQGCPDMDRRVIPELACRLHLTTDTATAWIGEALELQYRLPRLWDLVRNEKITVWRARTIAAATIELSREAARFVDAALSAVNGAAGKAQLERTIAHAKTMFMPEQAEREAAEAADRRDVQVLLDRAGDFHGLTQVSGWLDHVDGLELERALQTGAAALKAAGCEAPLGARRSMALGELARGQAALDLEGGDDEDATAARPARPKASRELILYVMIDGASGAGLAGTQRIPVCAENVRSWCGAPATTKITVKPVIDLNEPVVVPSYRIPDPLRERIALRDQGCAFPYCGRAAHPIPVRWTDDDQPVFGTDLDHIVPFADGGPTSTGNLAPLCRHHHRMKTLTQWRYVMLRPGVFCWVDPSGHVYLKSRQGTYDLPISTTPPGPPKAASGSPPNLSG